MYELLSMMPPYLVLIFVICSAMYYLLHFAPCENFTVYTASTQIWFPRVHVKHLSGHLFNSVFVINSQLHHSAVQGTAVRDITTAKSDGRFSHVC